MQSDTPAEKKDRRLEEQVETTIAHSVRAVYEDGWLKPFEPLLLPDHQCVEIMVTVLEEPQYLAHLKPAQQLHEKTTEWLAQQPAAAVREPDLPPGQEEPPGRRVRPVDGRDSGRGPGADDDAELAALVDEAVTAVREFHV